MKMVRSFFMATVLVSPAVARDFRPQSHFENIPLEDSSVQQCYVFQTTAGVEYRVESSNDLVHWTTQDELYGLGNEYVVTMREFTPAPPPPPGSPPAATPGPARNTSLLFRRSSGSAGGTVISWRSLEHGGPVVVRIAGEMAAGWSLMPFYVERYDAYNFLIAHAGDSATPPSQNPPLGSGDTAMLEVLEASLPAMNQKVTDSVSSARNVPPPAPADPDSKRFWRVHVNPDVDTDLDGSPDWAEFEIAARGTGSLVSGVSGNAFDADTNGDGIPDGKQLDADLDGTPDFADPDSTDNTANSPIGPLPRYALFPITNAQNESWERPFQINDRGTVLYSKGVWSGGDWYDLISPVEDDWFTARAINDNDVILGWGRTKVGDDPELFADVICSWDSPDAIPGFVSTDGGDASPSYDLSYDLLSPGTVLSNDGHFIAPTWGWEDDHYKRLHTGLWKLPSGSESATEQVGNSDLEWNQGTDLMWGWKYPRDSSGEEVTNSPPIGLVYAPALLPELPFTPVNVVANPGSPIIALPDIYEEWSARAYIGGSWKTTSTYAQALDIAADGTAIGRTTDGVSAPICLNGRWTAIDRTAPDVPSIWKDSTVKLWDTTPKGWILARRGGNWGDEHAVMLPIRVEESPPNEEFLEATGVDAYSIKSDDPGDPVSNKIWIMAPSGSGSTKVTLKSPINSNTSLKLSADGIKFDNNPDITLEQDGAEFNVAASDPASSGSDVSLTIKMGDVEAISHPVGVKNMKRRTVKISLHPVGSIVEGQAPNEPNTVPTETDLEEFLNKVFTSQINIDFDVTLIPASDFKWDTATPEDFDDYAYDPMHHLTVGNGWLDTNGSPTSYTEDKSIRTALNDSSANINIYILGGARIRNVLNWDNIIRVRSSLVFGLTRVAENTIFIDGDMGWYYTFLEQDPAEEQLRTIAHEIGHCLVGAGHADTGDAIVNLKGFNPKNLVQERLMVTGGQMRKSVPGYRLVKGEWDEAEKWLRKFVDNPQP